MKIHLRHPLLSFFTAFFLAVAGARFVSHFHLLDFAYAPALVFIVLFASYTLLTQKYELPLHAIFTVFVMVIFLKAVFLKNKISTVSAEDDIKTTLTTTATLIQLWTLDAGAPPENLALIAARWPSNDTTDLTYCTKNCSDVFPAIKNQPPSSFWLRYQNISRDKAKSDWYIADSFKIVEDRTKETSL